MTPEERALRAALAEEILAVIDRNNGFRDWPHMYMFGAMDGLHRAAAIVAGDALHMPPMIDRRSHGPRID